MDNFCIRSLVPPVPDRDVISQPAVIDKEERLVAWAKEALPGGKELRDQAVLALNGCEKYSRIHLDLNDLNLSALPPFMPKGVTALTVSGNNIAILGKNLPEGIRCVVADNNPELHIEWPDLPSTLTSIWASGCNLQSLPEAHKMSCCLTSLMVPNNPRLAHIPESLWATLERINISSCNFSTLPQNDAPHLTELVAANNPGLKEISEAVWDRLNSLDLSLCGRRLLISRRRGLHLFTYTAERWRNLQKNAGPPPMVGEKSMRA